MLGSEITWDDISYIVTMIVMLIIVLINRYDAYHKGFNDGCKARRAVQRQVKLRRSMSIRKM